jgi:hypothetical protein
MSTKKIDKRQALEQLKITNPLVLRNIEQGYRIELSNWVRERLGGSFHKATIRQIDADNQFITKDGRLMETIVVQLIIQTGLTRNEWAEMAIRDEWRTSEHDTEEFAVVTNDNIFYRNTAKSSDVELYAGMKLQKLAEALGVDVNSEEVCEFVQLNSKMDTAKLWVELIEQFADDIHAPIWISIEQNGKYQNIQYLTQTEKDALEALGIKKVITGRERKAQKDQLIEELNTARNDATDPAEIAMYEEELAELMKS